MNRFMHDDALGRAADLPSVPVTPEHGPLHRLVQVGVIQHDEGIRTAQLHRGLLQRPARLGRHQGPGPFGTRQGHALHARVVDDRLDLATGGVQVLEAPCRQPRLLHQLLEGGGRLRHVGGMLQEDDVARGQLRRHDAGNLVVREVPGFDGQDDAQRLVDQLGLGHDGILAGQRLRGQLRLGVLHVVLQDVRGQFHLGFGLGQQLAHLGGEKLRVFGMPGAQQVGCLLQERHPFLDGLQAPLLEGGMAALQGLGHFCIGGIGKGLQGLAGIGVGRLIGHGGVSFVQSFRMLRGLCR